MGLKPKDQEELIDFYVKMCKNLIWKIPSIKEKKLIAKWLKKIKFDKKFNSSVRCDYMTALMFMITKRYIFGPFLYPPTNKFLPVINQKYSLKNISLEYIKTKNSKEEKTKPECDFYHTISSDTREYAAVQEIPNFGTHLYMAASNDPMETWPYIPSYLTEIEKIEYYHPCLEIMANMNDISCYIDPNEINRYNSSIQDDNQYFNDSVDIVKNGSVELTRAPTWGSNLLAFNSGKIHSIDSEYYKNKERKYENQQEFLFDVFSKIDSEMEVFGKKYLKKTQQKKEIKSYLQSTSTTRTKFSLNDKLQSSDGNDQIRKHIMSKLKKYSSNEIENVECDGDYIQNESKINQNLHQIHSNQSNLRNDYSRIIKSCLSKNSKITKKNY